MLHNKSCLVPPRQLYRMLSLATPCLMEEEFSVLEGPNTDTATASRAHAHASSPLAVWLYNECDKLGSPQGALVLSEAIVGIVSTHDEDACQSYLFELLGEAEESFSLMAAVVERHSLLRAITPEQLRASGGKAIRTKPARTSKSAKLGSSTGIDWLAESGFSEAFLEKERSLGLQKNRRADMSTWKEDLAEEGTLEYQEKVGLPAGTERKQRPGYEEVDIPAPVALKKAHASELVSVSSLEAWAQLAFPGTKHLNRIQSVVFEAAYSSNQNLLICAPTGAGKTNIAMLTFLHLVKQHIFDGRMDRSAVKCIYVAPMKALAQEVVAKFSERLKPLGFVVKEFTGDMQLTKSEVDAANLIVTTPEKWDVVTRKGGEGSLGTMISLLIIDEIHLLADDRGAVIETIVARTQRYVESSQKMIRLVGLSATLPNYKDVASFLNVNMKSGLFYFGPEYRPVPLDQTLIGVTEKSKAKKNDVMNKIAYDKMVDALERDKQVMIFVHARKETARTATAMRDLSAKFGTLSLLENIQHEQYLLWKKSVDKSRSQELQQLFACGLGMHHAGMLRPDRTLTERLFECGLIKVLVCTSTLAWCSISLCMYVCV